MSVEGMESPFGRYLEEFREGQTFRHWPGKTITDTDNVLFSLLTMNHHPVHLDHNFAKDSEHGRVLVVGTLVFSVGVGLTVRDVSGRAIANLGYESIRHEHPVFLGDTLYAESRVLEVRVSRTKPDRGIVRVTTNVRNQDNQRVLSFERAVLIPKRSAGQ